MFYQESENIITQIPDLRLEIIAFDKYIGQFDIVQVDLRVMRDDLKISPIKLKNIIKKYTELGILSEYAIYHCPKHEDFDIGTSDIPEPYTCPYCEVEYYAKQCPYELIYIRVLKPTGDGMSSSLAITSKNNVFVSYSHKDNKWLEIVQTHLKPLTRNGKLDVWVDTRIRASEEWKKEIDQALQAADIAVLLVSPNFLASDFIVDHELPALLDAAKSRGTKIAWIPISFSLFEETDIAKYQAVLDPKTPLDTFKGPARNGKLVKIAQDIRDLAK